MHAVPHRFAPDMSVCIWTLGVSGFIPEELLQARLAFGASKYTNPAEGFSHLHCPVLYLHTWAVDVSLPEELLQSSVLL